MPVHFLTDDLPLRDREPCWLDILAKHVMKVTPSDRPDSAAYWGQLERTGHYAVYIS
jgi:hypothetical protein